MLHSVVARASTSSSLSWSADGGASTTSSAASSSIASLADSAQGSRRRRSTSPLKGAPQAKRANSPAIRQQLAGNAEELAAVRERRLALDAVAMPPPAARSLPGRASALSQQVKIGHADEFDKDGLYVGAFIRSCFEREAHFAPDEGFMERQADVTAKMRAILVDWLVDVHLKFKLQPDALHLTVNLLDRYLSLRPVSRKKLQLIGMTCMHIAGKVHEIYPPELRDYCNICDRAYTGQEIMDMELDVLLVLKFECEAVSPLSFLSLFIGAANVDVSDSEVVQFASFLVDLTLQEYASNQFALSTIAAAAVYVACRQLGRGEPNRLRSSRVQDTRLVECAHVLSALCFAHQKHAAQTGASLSASFEMSIKPNANTVAVVKKYGKPQRTNILGVHAATPVSMIAMQPSLIEALAAEAQHEQRVAVSKSQSLAAGLQHFVSPAAAAAVSRYSPVVDAPSPPTDGSSSSSSSSQLKNFSGVSPMGKVDLANAGLDPAAQSAALQMGMQSPAPTKSWGWRIPSAAFAASVDGGAMGGGMPSSPAYPLMSPASEAAVSAFGQVSILSPLNVNSFGQFGAPICGGGRADV